MWLVQGIEGAILFERQQWGWQCLQSPVAIVVGERTLGVSREKEPKTNKETVTDY